MRRLTAPPRISREGFIPAGPEKRITKRHMLIPKTGDPTEHIPRLFDFSEVICPAERRALREIVETAEVVRQNGHVYLTARVSSATLDRRATFETSREDLEDGGDHEPSIGVDHPIDGERDDSDLELEPDLEDGHDDEFDYRDRRFDPGRAGTWRPLGGRQ